MSGMDTTPPQRTTAPHISLGARGEDLAADHLAMAGMELLARNWRIADGAMRGELDLLCRDGDDLVVVEVKTRRTDRFGLPIEAVDHRKRARIRKLAAAFLRESGLRVRGIRFDVVGVVIDRDGVRVDHVRGAF